MWFAFKAMMITVVLVFFMQIKVGESTIEESAHQWIKSSYLVVYLNEVSRGSVIALREGYQSLTSLMGEKAKQQFQSGYAPGNRSILPSLDRSKSYMRELQEKAKKLDVQEVADGIKDYKEKLKEVEAQLEEKRKPAQEEESW